MSENFKLKFGVHRTRKKINSRKELFVNRSVKLTYIIICFHDKIKSETFDYYIISSHKLLILMVNS